MVLCSAETDTGYGHGSLKGYSEDVHAYKVWDVLNGLGDMAFAYSFSFILLEISVSLSYCLLPCSDPSVTLLQIRSCFAQCFLRFFLLVLFAFFA